MPISADKTKNLTHFLGLGHDAEESRVSALEAVAWIDSVLLRRRERE